MSADRRWSSQASASRSASIRSAATTLVGGIVGSAVVWTLGTLAGIRFQPVVFALVCLLITTLWWAHRIGLVPSDDGPAWPDPLLEPSTSTLTETDVTTRRLSHLITAARPERRFEARALGLELSRLSRETCSTAVGAAPDAPLEDLRIYLGSPLTDYLALAEDDLVQTPPLGRAALRAHLRVLRSLSTGTDSDPDHARS